MLLQLCADCPRRRSRAQLPAGCRRDVRRVLRLVKAFHRTGSDTAIEPACRFTTSPPDEGELQETDHRGENRGHGAAVASRWTRPSIAIGAKQHRAINFLPHCKRVFLIYTEFILVLISPYGSLGGLGQSGDTRWQI